MNFKIIKYVFLSVLFICFTNLSYAQSYPIYQKLSKIAVLDQDSLFSKTEWGKNILKNVEGKVAQLASENRFIESELVREELNLTNIRKNTSKIEFDILAFDFDVKVKKLEMSNL